MYHRKPLFVLGILLAALLPAMFRMVWPFFTPLILATILAIVIAPVHRHLSRRIHSEGLATLVTTFTTVLLLGVIITFSGIAVTRELRSSYDELSRRSLQEGGWPALATRTVDRLVETLAARLPIDREALRTEFLDGLKSATGYLLNNVGSAVGGLTAVVVNGVFTALLLYFLLRYGRIWMTRFTMLMPLDRHITTSLFRTIHDSVVANVNGVVAVALGQGLFVSLGFWIAGVRSPALWGAMAGLASVIPVVGSPLVWVPVVVAFLLMGVWWKAVFLGLWGAFVVGSIDNVLRPLVVGARAKQHPMLIAFAAIGGTYAFGVLGILLGPLVVSLAAAVLKEIQTIRAGEESDV